MLNLDVLPFIKNVEGAGLPAKPKVNKLDNKEDKNLVQGLIRQY